MRTLILVLSGLAVFAALVGIARLVGKHKLGAAALATRAFIGLWFVVAAANLWVGVSQAGYSFSEELPSFALIFAVPAAVAVFVLKRLGS